MVVVVEVVVAAFGRGDGGHPWYTLLLLCAAASLENQPGTRYHRDHQSS